MSRKSTKTRKREETPVGYLRNLIGDPAFLEALQKYIACQDDEKSEPMKLTTEQIVSDCQHERKTALSQLWGGKGHVTRFEFDLLDRPFSLVLKLVEGVADGGRGGSRGGNARFERTLQSYRNEFSFYEHVAEILLAGDIRVPRPIALWKDDVKLSFVFLFDDMTTTHPCIHEDRDLSLLQVKACLRWLAALHARFYGQPPKGVWERGTYWNLDKRKAEHAQMVQEWTPRVAAQYAKGNAMKLFGQRLHAAAAAIDVALRSPGRLQRLSLVHGDAKGPNFFFSHDDRRHAQNAKPLTAAACDFQWCGCGLGVQDVMYLLFSSTDPTVLSQNEPELLSFYLDELRSVCPSVAQYKLAALQSDYQLAILDYVRFLMGWGLWGANVRILVQRAQQYLEEVDKGELLSAQEYHNRISKHFSK